MKPIVKPLEELTPADLESCPIWEFTNANEEDMGETAVRSVGSSKVKTLAGRVVGTMVQLANGNKVWAMLGNIDHANPRATRHFLTITVFRAKRSFTLARYHDVGAEKRGPKALARFLGLAPDDVFPISYDVTRLCVGDPAALAGVVEKEPKEKLSFSELLALGN
jgi:hypothetical protein